MGPIITSHLDKYPNLEYVAQDLDTLRLLMWREGSTTQKDPNAMPFHPSHPFFRDDKTLFFMDPWPWIDHLRDVDFVFGNRIHGNIAGLLAGTPSYVLSHDTRTLELSRYFDIPHRAMNDVSPDTDAADLFAEADYGPMMTGHAARFRTFIDYLERHGLHHIFEPGEDTHSFDQRVASIEYPPPVRLQTGSRVMRGTASGAEGGPQVREQERATREALAQAPRDGLTAQSGPVAVSPARPPSPSHRAPSAA